MVSRYDGEGEGVRVRVTLSLTLTLTLTRYDGEGEDDACPSCAVAFVRQPAEERDRGGDSA